MRGDLRRRVPLAAERRRVGRRGSGPTVREPPTDQARRPRRTGRGGRRRRGRPGRRPPAASREPGPRRPGPPRGGSPRSRRAGLGVERSSASAKRSASSSISPRLYWRNAPASRVSGAGEAVAVGLRQGDPRRARRTTGPGPPGLRTRRRRRPAASTNAGRRRLGPLPQTRGLGAERVAPGVEHADDDVVALEEVPEAPSAVPSPRVVRPRARARRGAPRPAPPRPRAGRARGEVVGRGGPSGRAREWAERAVALVPGAGTRRRRRCPRPGSARRRGASRGRPARRGRRAAPRRPRQERPVERRAADGLVPGEGPGRGGPWASSTSPRA